MESISTPAILVLLALIQYMFFSLRVGLSREKFGVIAPKCVGNDTWERLFRVQQNTLEQLIIFIPGVFLFSYYVSNKWVLLPGCTFIVGRFVFYYLYTSNPKNRGFGFIPTFMSNSILVIGSLIGILITKF